MKTKIIFKYDILFGLGVINLDNGRELSEKIIIINKNNTF
jgi:hypothetical protein